jgi:hypothetical protein
MIGSARQLKMMIKFIHIPFFASICVKSTIITICIRFWLELATLEGSIGMWLEKQTYVWILDS